MKEIYVNLKRFDVPVKFGGICPHDDPAEWMHRIVEQTVRLGLGRIEDVSIAYFLPESLLIPAMETLRKYKAPEIGRISLGCQGVYREDVVSGGNFGAFTTNRPAAAMQALGCTWAIIGHSEERRDKLGMLAAYDENIGSDADLYRKAAKTVDLTLNMEVKAALSRDLNVLFCVGETAEEKGSDIPAEYQPRVKNVLREQLLSGLMDIARSSKGRKIAIAYEPIWAIGPGKTPPGGDYVDFVSGYIKEICQENIGIDITVVYGGGLKEENAAEMAAVKNLDGGLVALTKFTPPIAFDVNSLHNIIRAYIR